ncbi:MULTISPECIES: O-antigen ligase family protein [unclassified Pseudomonas]|uniref:O-antigen ligase family protein n=1 Tax=unclassified Pseudomonas TaxID=196821 RepID=UPI0019112840|nr:MULTISPECIES: O-antigen ligase family protein [unclassified Pseudomonas]MBK5551231.1 O-antigen ligase family protein [Pseudomonas sp. TH03]MEB0225525.1 O-antigen ligase family protein [Pseudomonas sp. 5S1]MEB0293528.1 O-antigen ligase family protein [Pseudomonas sp. 10S4]WPX16471.1 O-antigen ligase family protein [Pseudomonas sp. 10S4]
MIFPLSIVSLLGLVCLGLLASPYPYLAPGAVLGLVGVAVLYRKPTWGLLGIVALVPFEGFFKDSALSGTKFVGASLALILMLQLAIHQLPSERLRSNIWRYLIWFMILYMLSLMNSDDLGMSFGHLRELSVGLILFVITLLIGRDLNLDLFAKLVTLSVSLTCVLAMFSTKYQDQGRAAGLLEDPNAFALLIAFAIPLGLLLVIRSPNLLHRLFWGGCCLLLLGGMTKTESRSGLVVLMLSLVIGVWHYRAQLPRIRPRHLGFAMLGMAIVIPLAIYAMPAGYIARIQSLSVLSAGAKGHDDESLGRRASYIVVGSQMIRENPLLGSGPGTFPLHYATTGYAKAFSANRKVGDLYRRAHNTYMEVFSELGIPAGLLFVGMLALGLYNLIRARRAWMLRRNWEQTDLMTHLGMSFLSLTLFLMFLSAPSQKYVWIMLALTSVLRLKAEEAPLVEAKV